MSTANRSSVLRALKDLPIGPILLLLPVFICGIMGQYLMPHDPAAIKPELALHPPSWLIGGGWTYILGTDYLGRDVLSRVISGARASLIVSFMGVGLAGTIGISLGLFSAFFGGWIDTLLMRLVDIEQSMPGILLALLLSAALGAGLSSVIIVVGILYWMDYARVIRGETLSVKERDFVRMARVLGAPSKRLIGKHILPNVIDSAVVVATLQLGRAVMFEATLSFLGLGVQPPAVAWGRMIAEARLYLATSWWLPTFPGMALVVTVLGANLLGDWLRDHFDPKLRQI